MGLDTVELVMAFEERFGIAFADEDAEKIVTVRDAIDHIYASVRQDQSGQNVCLSQRAFYRLRKAAQSEFGVRRSEVRPRTPLEAIVPLEGRRQAWLRLKDATGVDAWPALSRSPETIVLIAAASSTVAIASILIAPANGQLAGAAAALTAALMTRSTQHLRVRFSAPETFGQLADYLVERSTPALKDGKGWTRDEVRAAVRAIVVDHLNVDPSFSDDARFVDDLGAD